MQRSALRIVAVLAFLMAVAPPLPAQTLAPDDPDEAPLWTDRPVHVDPARQGFERLPSTVTIDPHVEGISVPGHVRVPDSASFMIGRTRYVMRHVRGIAASRYCRHADGTLWPCGRMSAIFLGNLVRGERMQCDEPDAPAAGKDKSKDGVALVLDCQVRGKRIAAEIVRMGFGHATGDDELAAIESAARANRAGIWKDEACLSNFETC